MCAFSFFIVISLFVCVWSVLCFQAPNHIPIHLKGGPVDKVLFGATVVLCVVGLGGCFQFFYEMAFPPKKAD